MTQLPDDIYKPQMTATSDKAVLIVTDDKTEDLEFFYPYYRFIEEGYRVDVATPDGKGFNAKHGLGLQETLKLNAVDPASYDLLYIPGGKAPSRLKNEEEALSIVKNFANSGKTIAAICHGPQLLAEADVIRGRTISAWPDVEKEVTKAGATYVSQQCCLDGQFVTARWPADLPAFTARVIELLKKGSKPATKLAA